MEASCFKAHNDVFHTHTHTHTEKTKRKNNNLPVNTKRYLRVRRKRKKFNNALPPYLSSLGFNLWPFPLSHIQIQIEMLLSVPSTNRVFQPAFLQVPRPVCLELYLNSLAQFWQALSLFLPPPPPPPHGLVNRIVLFITLKDSYCGLVNKLE